MKKILLLSAGLSLLTSGAFCAEFSAIDTSKDTLKVVSIDSRSLLQKSKEGQKLASSIQKDLEKFQSEVKSKQQELVEFQETINKQAQANALSKEALTEKTEKLALMKKNAERELSDKEEVIKGKIQRQQATLIEKQLTIASDVFEQEKWGMMVDKNTPGVFFVARALDKTDEILKIVDKKYDEENSKKLVAKNNSKTEKKA